MEILDLIQQRFQKQIDDWSSEEHQVSVACAGGTLVICTGVLVLLGAPEAIAGGISGMIAKKVYDDLEDSNDGVDHKMDDRSVG